MEALNRKEEVMHGPGSPNSNERGAALVIALLVLTVLIVVSAAMVTTSVVNTRLSGVDQRRAKALDLAEAGIGEAVGRIKAGDVPDNSNPRMVAQIYNVNAGSAPVLGADSISLPTAQPAGNWLNYSTEGRNPYALTVRYKTDANRMAIYKYDVSQSIPVQTTSGMAIYQIQSTGRVGNAVRTVVAEVTPVPLNINVRGAMVCNKAVTWSGNDRFCGYNHRSDTPTGTGSGGRSGGGGCNAAPGQWEVAGALAGIWSNAAIVSPGGYAQGSPLTSQNQPAPFYTGPWDALGMTQAQFYAWVGPPTNTAPGVPKGIVYLDNNGTAQDQSGSFTFTGGDGDGFLYVDGDLNLNGNFHFKGLIYAEGNITVNANAWVLGGVIERGKSPHDNHANGTFLYSRDSIIENIGRYGAYATISWREVSL